MSLPCVCLLVILLFCLLSRMSWCLYTCIYLRIVIFRLLVLKSVPEFILSLFFGLIFPTLHLLRCEYTVEQSNCMPPFPRLFGEVLVFLTLHPKRCEYRGEQSSQGSWWLLPLVNPRHDWSLVGRFSIFRFSPFIHQLISILTSLACLDLQCS